jgi:heme exporter protein B
LDEIFRNLRKDILLEFRNSSAAGVAIAFALVITLAVSVISAGVSFSPAMQSTLLWLIIFFSAMNSLLHIFTREEDEHTALFLRLKISPENVYTSKLIFNMLFFFFIELLVCAMFIFFAGIAIQNYLMFALAAAGGGTAIVSTSTIVSAIAAKAGGKGTLFTVIASPLLLPVLLVDISVTKAGIEGGVHSYGKVFFLFAFSGAIILVSYLLFRYVWIEE